MLISSMNKIPSTSNVEMSSRKAKNINSIAHMEFLESYLRHWSSKRAASSPHINRTFSAYHLGNVVVKNLSNNEETA